MTRVHTVLLAALLVVLSIIAFDLHRLASSVAGPVVPRYETREQRNERLRREADELGEDWKALWTEPKPAPKKQPAK